MHSILFIANGPESATQTGACLRDAGVVIVRVATAQEARGQLAAGSFDAIVCAIDDFSRPAQECIALMSAAADTPRVVVLRDWTLPVQSVDISVRVVALEDGPQELQRALRQQFRRIPPRARNSRARTRRTCEFSFSFRAESERISRACAVVGGFVQRCLTIDDSELKKLETVIEEALRNAVVHGSRRSTATRAANPGDAATSGPQVAVKLVIDEQNIRVTIADEGPGFDVSATAAGDDRESIYKPAGRGLVIMKAYADSVEFNEAGNAVTLVRCRKAIETNAAEEPAFAEEEQAGGRQKVMAPSLPEDPSHAR